MAEQAKPKKANMFRAGGASSSLVQMNANRQAMQSVSTKYNITCIPFEKIEVNLLNKDFSQEDAELLMYSIIRNGLYHPLTVIFDPAKGVYRLISGEQRYRAISMMDEATRKENFPEGIPVNIKKATGTELDEEIMIIEANIIGRNYTPEKKSEHIRKLLELYQKKQALGEIDNAVKKIMELTSLSERQVRNYVAVNNKMIPELKEALDNKTITLKESVKLANFSEEAQLEIYNMLMSAGKLDENELAAMEKVEKENKELQKQIAVNTRALAEKEKLINSLNRKIEEAESKKANGKKVVGNEPTVTEADAEVGMLKELLAKEEAKSKRLQTEYEKLCIQEKENKQRGINLSSEELKRAANIAKAENLYDSIFAQFKEAEKLKTTIASDENLKCSFEILAGLFTNAFTNN